MIEVKNEIPKPAEVKVVREFVEVFPKDLLGLRPNKGIEFSIELLLGENPISIPHYRMTGR